MLVRHFLGVLLTTAAPMPLLRHASVCASLGRQPRQIILAPASQLQPHDVALAEFLDAELTAAQDEREKKQARVDMAESCMAAYVSSPMIDKAQKLEHFAHLVITGLDSGAIAKDASTAVLQGTVLTFDTTKHGTPRAEAAAALDMARKLRRQQSKLDALRHRNEGTTAALVGWQKRVRVAAARGESAALRALHAKLLSSHKRLGLRRNRLQAFVADADDDTFGI